VAGDLLGVFQGLLVVGWGRVRGDGRVSRAFAVEVSFGGCAERERRAAVLDGRLLAVKVKRPARRTTCASPRHSTGCCACPAQRSST